MWLALRRCLLECRHAHPKRQMKGPAMLTRTNLRALLPGKCVRTRVPDGDCWKEPGTSIHPGEEVDVCVMPRYEPRYDYSNHFDWYYGVAYRRAGSDCFHKERKDGYFISTWDFGLISPLDPRFHASTEERRAYCTGARAHTCTSLPATIPSSAQAVITRAISVRCASATSSHSAMTPASLSASSAR